MDPQLRTVTVNGATLTSIEAGSGDPLVFVHGSLGDYRAWGFQTGPFAERYRVIAYSRRRHWPNPWPAENSVCSVEEHSADLGGLIDELGLESPILIGSSYGALTTLTLAARRPGIARLVVLGEPPLFPWLMATDEGSERFSDFQTDAWLPARHAFRREDPQGGVRLFMDGAFGEGSFDRMPSAALERFTENAAVMGIELETPPEIYYGQLTREEVSSIRCPVLLLNGEVSPRIFHIVIDELEPVLPNVERAEIPRTSHVMHAGNPEDYNQTVLDFLSRH
jgi:pimeloyl-ACP methyl ester carboxylesterase